MSLRHFVLGWDGRFAPSTAHIAFTIPAPKNVWTWSYFFIEASNGMSYNWVIFLRTFEYDGFPRASSMVFPAPLLCQSSRHFYRFMKEARVLLANAAVVESTFHELDPGFSTCFRYENMTDPSQASRVAEFVAPTEHIAQRLAQTMVAFVKRPPSAGYLRRDTHGRQQMHGGHETHPKPNVAQAVVVERLQQKLDKIEKEQCLF